MTYLENGNKPYESEHLRKLEGVILLADADDFLVDGTRSLAISYLREKYGLGERECLAIESYYYRFGKYPGWEKLGIPSEQIERDITSLYGTKGIHSYLKVSEDTQGEIQRFVKMGGTVLVHSSRRARDQSTCAVLHSELVATINQGNLPVASVITMAGEIANGNISPSQNSTAWKLSHGEQMRRQFKYVIFGDDSHPVIEAATQKGFGAIELAFPHNYPNDFGMPITGGETALIPGMRRIPKQSNIVGASLSLVSEQRAWGKNIFSKTASIESLPIVG